MRYDPNNPKMLANWFNVYNLEHVEAFDYTIKNSKWPQTVLDLFDSGEVIIHDYWEAMLRGMLADAWIKHIGQLMKPLFRKA